MSEIKPCNVCAAPVSEDAKGIYLGHKNEDGSEHSCYTFKIDVKLPGYGPYGVTIRIAMQDLDNALRSDVGMQDFMSMMVEPAFNQILMEYQSRRDGEVDKNGMEIAKA